MSCKAFKTSASSGTFSILAMSPDSGSVGVATASGSVYVGDRVPYAKPGVGVIATQAYTNVNYGIKGLELLAKKIVPQKALNMLLTEDPERDRRQVAIMDFNGRKAAFTGVKAPEYRAQVVGKDHVVIGNLLSGKDVARSMAEQFENSSGTLSWRLAKALEAGNKEGGDKRGEKSAALIVVNAEVIEVATKVDIHENPIEELLRKLKKIVT